MSRIRIIKSVLDFNEEEAILYRYFTSIFIFGRGVGDVFFNLEYVTSELPHCTDYHHYLIQFVTYSEYSIQ